MIVSPSILAADFLNLEEEIKRINKTNCQWIHLDVMDGLFVQDITFGYPLIKQIKEKTNKKLDVHLMVKYPQKLAQRLCEIKVDFLTVHAETIKNIDFDLLLKISKENNVKFGLALNPNTTVKEYEEYINKVDYILLMSVFPGKGGQQFMPEVLTKEKEIRSLKNGGNIIINIDGGINDKTIKEIKKTSIDAVVSGSFLFNGSMQENIDLLS